MTYASEVSQKQWWSKNGWCATQEQARVEDADYRLREAIQLGGDFTNEDAAAETLSSDPAKWLVLLAELCAARTALARKLVP